ncbi:hypothetical protein J3F83DRAFT_736727 [Trichoderma novae-zelandiae]
MWLLYPLDTFLFLLLLCSLFAASAFFPFEWSSFLLSICIVGTGYGPLVKGSQMDMHYSGT